MLTKKIHRYLGDQIFIREIGDRRRKCSSCDKKFGDDATHWIVEMNQKLVYANRKSYRHHLQCYQFWIRRDRICSNRIIGFESLPEAKQIEIGGLFWPHFVVKHLRPRLTLPKHIDEMDAEEIRIECEKRDLPQHLRFTYRGCYYSTDITRNKEELIKYLNNDKDCKQLYDVMVKGYCKQIAQISQLNVPIYLQDIVLRYYPVVF